MIKAYKTPAGFQITNGSKHIYIDEWAFKRDDNAPVDELSGDANFGGYYNNVEFIGTHSQMKLGDVYAAADIIPTEDMVALSFDESIVLQYENGRWRYGLQTSSLEGSEYWKILHM